MKTFINQPENYGGIFMCFEAMFLALGRRNEYMRDCSRYAYYWAY